MLDLGVRDGCLCGFLCGFGAVAAGCYSRPGGGFCRVRLLSGTPGTASRRVRRCLLPRVALTRAWFQLQASRLHGPAAHDVNPQLPTAVDHGVFGPGMRGVGRYAGGGTPPGGWGLVRAGGEPRGSQLSAAGDGGVESAGWRLPWPVARDLRPVWLAARPRIVAESAAARAAKPPDQAPARSGGQPFTDRRVRMALAKAAASSPRGVRTMRRRISAQAALALVATSRPCSVRAA